MPLAQTLRPADRLAVGWPSVKGERWMSPLAIFLLWEMASRIGLLPSHVLAAPSSVLRTAWDLTVSGQLPFNILISLGRVVAGLAIGLVIGTTIAVLAGLTKTGENAFDPPIQMLRALPPVALSPLFILWFGIGEVPKVALIALGATFPIYLNLYNGIRGVAPKLVEAARSFGLRRWQLVAHVILPGALPSFLLGLRFALASSWLILVVAEQINASAGLGYLINNARDLSRTDIILVCLLVYASFGLGADAIVRAIERRVLAWRPSFIKS